MEFPSRPVSISHRFGGPSRARNGSRSSGLTGLSQSMPPPRPTMKGKNTSSEPPALWLEQNGAPISSPEAHYYGQRFAATKNGKKVTPRLATSAPVGRILSTSFRNELGCARLDAVVEKEEEPELKCGSLTILNILQNRATPDNSRPGSPSQHPSSPNHTSSSPLMFALTLEDEPPSSLDLNSNLDNMYHFSH